MKRIRSFGVDHRRLGKGIYISRIDGDCVTYDLRFCRPNSGNLLSNAEIHTTEHMMATFLRNSKYSRSVIYFGPMGCQTGFYLVMRDDVSPEEAAALVKDCLKKTAEYEGEVFGASEEECGNYRNLELECAKRVCGEYLKVIENTKKIPNYDEI